MDLITLRNKLNELGTNEIFELLEGKRSIGEINLDRSTVTLILNVLVKKSYSDRKIITNEYTERNNIYSLYLGYYLAYIIDINGDEKIKQEILSEIDIYFTRENPSSIVTGYILYTDDVNRTNMLVKLVNIIKDRRDESFILVNILPEMLDEKYEDSKMLNKVFDNISFEFSPSDMINVLITDTRVDFTGGGRWTIGTGYGYLYGTLLMFIVDYYGVGFSNLVKMINEKGRDDVKVWLEKTILNQV